MVNGTLLNFGKRYKDNLRVIFNQWPKLHLGLDALSNQKILKGIYCSIYGSNNTNKILRILRIQKCFVMQPLEIKARNRAVGI